MEIRVKSDDLVTVPEAAWQLGRAKMTLYRWIDANKIVSIKLGGILFIPKSEIERLNEPNRVKALREEQNKQAAGGKPAA